MSWCGVELTPGERKRAARISSPHPGQKLHAQAVDDQTRGRDSAPADSSKAPLIRPTRTVPAPRDWA